jgi:putative ABC transport system permease protein
MMNRHLSLAWHNLLHNKRRLLVSVAGITLAVVLMFTQVGFLFAFLDASVALVEQLNGQLIVVARGRYSLTAAGRFPIHRLEQVKALAGVKAAYPLYLESNLSRWKALDGRFPDPDEPTSRPIRVIGIDPTTPALRLAEVRNKQDLLKTPNTVLMDRLSKETYGKHDPGVRAELARHGIKILGNFSLGTDFTTDGNVITSDETFAKLFPNPHAPRSTLRLVDVGVVQLDDTGPATVAGVQAALQQRLPDDVWVFTHAQFVNQEWWFWMTSTPIGFIFLFGLIVGLIVGLVICWQILSADVSDRLKEYATLKALGYTNNYLRLVVLQQGVWLALLGYLPALGIAALLYEGLGQYTGLPLLLDAWKIGCILVLTIMMCVGSGLLTLRRVSRTDPAEVFT